MTIHVSEISGFKEYLPEEQIELERMKRVIAKHYEQFGYAPIEVAAIEREQVLLSKSGENTRQIYGIHLLNRSDQEHGEADKKWALHFDLTVPLARYVAQNYGKLVFPFRRYQIQKVWRGERPQVKKGRFREFYQCDIDVIGDGQLSLIHDAEMPFVIQGIFSELNIGKFLVRLNNRKITSGIMESLGIPETYVGGTIDDEEGRLTSDEKSRYSFSLLDTMEKMGTELVEEAYKKFLGLDASVTRKLIEIVTHAEHDAQATLEWLKAQNLSSKLLVTGIQELSEVIGHMLSFEMDPMCFAVDFRITRGLDYYTGTVYETVLVNHEGIGSVCSGGRYDDLANTFIERKMPGVGISIGLTRLFNSLQQSKIVDCEHSPQSTAKVLIIREEAELQPDYFQLGSALRAAGIPCEVYFEDRAVEKQIKYARRKRIPYMILMNAERKGRGMCRLRHIDGDDQEVSIQELVQHLS